MKSMVLLNTPLGYDLMYSMYVRALARSPGGRARLYYDNNKNIYYIRYIGLSNEEIGKNLLKTLYELREHVSSLRASIPLIIGGPGTDGYNVQKILGSKPRRKADYRIQFYNNILNYLKQYLNELLDSLSINNYSVKVDGNLLHLYGGSKAQYSVPSIYKHEILYELGKFGGLRDYVEGRPNIGRVEIRVSPELYMYLVALAITHEIYVSYSQQTVERIYISLVPSKVKLGHHRARILDEMFDGLLNWLSKTQAIRLYGEPDVFSLVIGYWLYTVDKDEALTNTGFRIGVHVFSETGKRFQKKHYTFVDNSLLKSIRYGLRRLGYGRSETILIGEAVRDLLVSTYLLAIDTGLNTFHKLACYARNIALGFIGLPFKPVLDQIYDLYRTIHDPEIRARTLGKLANVIDTDKSVAGNYLANVEEAIVRLIDLIR